MKLNKINDWTWEIPKTGRMNVPGRIIASEKLLTQIRSDKAAEQVANVACLPGIVGYALAMPDAHWGYGFPIGGVAATDPEQGGVVSPGGVGYDINCGVRLMTTKLEYSDIRSRVRDMVTALYKAIPCGIGSEGAIRALDKKNMDAMLAKGAAWAVSEGYGTKADLDTTEEGGCMSGANPRAVSNRAKERGSTQVGTLGSGNHFAELQVVEKIFQPNLAEAFGLHEGQVVLMIHSGSRGLGYQVCDDFIHTMLQAASKYRIHLPDKQLCCAPVNSQEGHTYLAAMACAANYAWTNRQIMMDLARRALRKTLEISAADLGGKLLYDVCHNIAKFETHEVDGKARRLCVHRKGATRAFPGDNKDVPAIYRHAGQPVLVPGSMGTGSFVCAGTQGAMNLTFGSCCHGAGRTMSRTQAKKSHDASKLLAELENQGIYVMARSNRTVVEEAPNAYKRVDDVADVCQKAGIGKKVARLRPIGVVKG